MIKCEICGKEFKRLRQHLMKKHGISTRKYRAIYPGAPIVDPDYSKKMRELRTEKDVKNFKQNKK
jgi:predicted transcriptional regulator